MQRDVGPDALERRLQHLRVARAHPVEQLGDLGGGVLALDEVHLQDGHAATLVIVEEPAKGPGASPGTADARVPATRTAR